MKKFIVSTLAACINNYHAFGGTYISSYNPDGSANVMVYAQDYDNANATRIALYNTSGQVLQISTAPWLNFILPKGAHRWTAIKDVCTDGSFAGHWDRGPAW